MEYKGQYWLTNARMVRYQTMLCENPQVKLKAVRILNPVTLLLSAVGSPDHDCVEVINKIFSSRPELCDLDHKIFTDGKSFLKEETRYTGCTGVTLDAVLEAQALAPDMLAQKAELTALTHALQLVAKRTVNIT
jgi:hypothetical protein